MDIQTLDWARDLKRRYITEPEYVLDVGSLNINGTFRGLFTDAKQYLGIDLQEGPDVDMVGNGNELGKILTNAYFDVVICMNTLEHDPYFWKTLAEINKVIKKDGWFFVGMPTFTFPIHNHPDDYYRFGESAFRQVILDGYEVIDLKHIFTKESDGKGINPVINVLGRKL